MKAFVVCLFLATIASVLAIANTAPRPPATCDAAGAIAAAVAHAKRGC